MIKVRMRQKDYIDLRQVMKMERGRSQSFRADGAYGREGPADLPTRAALGDGVRNWPETRPIRVGIALSDTMSYSL